MLVFLLFCFTEMNENKIKNSKIQNQFANLLKRKNEMKLDFYIIEILKMPILIFVAFFLKECLHKKKWQLIFDTKEKLEATQVDHDVQPESC